MDRRALLRTAAAAAALSLLPRQAEAAWTRALGALTSGVPARGPLTDAQRATVAAIADAILPRTDTPGALDVEVPAWIEVVVADHYDDAQRTAFLAGLDAIDALARERTAQPMAALRGDALATVMTALDTPADRTTPAARGYARLKGLVVHGYFTSRAVQQDVLQVQVIPGRFDGDAPMPARGAARDE
jgi:hypothetical protein